MPERDAEYLNVSVPTAFFNATYLSVVVLQPDAGGGYS